jgi:succinylglutamate desuccinylase
VDGSSYERLRAAALNAELGPKPQEGQESPLDFLLDLHNTTANMGVTLILSARDPLTMRVAAELAHEFRESVRIYLQPEARPESPYLGTLARADICLEAGPQAHGTLDAALFGKVEAVMLRMLELLAASRNGGLGAPCRAVEVFTETGNIDYPRDADGAVCAMIHPALQGRDYEALLPGEPAFLDFEGKTILWQGEATWPAFVNEAAYYEKGIAMSLTQKTEEVW